MNVLMRTTDRPDGFRTDADIAAGKVAIDGAVKMLSHLSLLPPTQGRVYGILFNFKGALAEAMADEKAGLWNEPYNGPPDAPVFYLKLPNTVAANGAEIILPYDCGSEELRIDASLGVVIGCSASRLTRKDAMRAVAGYTIACDVTIPHTNYYRPPIRHRCRDGFCPVGPWVVDKKDIPEPANLGLRVFIDGRLKGRGHTSDWIRSIPDLLCELTDIVSLCPGDVVLTGAFAGAPVALAGQSVRIEIDGIGALENTVSLEENVGGVS
ncbi:MAG: fumarylacetoacetate hydrolase family protein [Deltaproteobacteria bacterium]|nr:fumarylacetoacetate hydrolase family protein [Deltaproteobacteria bacterium]